MTAELEKHWQQSSEVLRLPPTPGAVGDIKKGRPHTPHFVLNVPFSQVIFRDRFISFSPSSTSEKRRERGTKRFGQN